MEDPIMDFKGWYVNRPPITRLFLTCSTILAGLLSFKLIQVHQICYTFNETVPTLQIWRPLTSLLFLGEFNISFLFQGYFAYFALSSAERDLFEKSKLADYLTLQIYIFCMMILAASFINLYFIADGFMFALIYVWCKKKPFQEISFFFDIRLTSGYFPWVYLGFTVLMGQPFLNLVIAFFIAHLYLYIKGPLCEKLKIDLLFTPSLLKSFVNAYLSWESRYFPVQPQGEHNEDQEDSDEENEQDQENDDNQFH